MSETAYLESLNPGIITSQSQGKLIVSKVVPHSPAEASGIRVGDEIVTINDNKRSKCGQQSWIHEGSQFTDLLLRRHGATISVRVGLLSVRALLDLNWIGPAREIVRTSANKTTADREYDDYRYGFRAIVNDKSIVVNGVLGGAAAEGGLLPGDRIVQLNDIEVQGGQIRRSLQLLENTSRLIVLVNRSGVLTRVVLRATPLSVALRKLEPPSMLALAER